MKKILLFALVITTTITAMAQNSNAVFFNQTNTRFQVVLNGELQNNDYATNVKVTDLKFEGSYKVTINFEDAVHPSITKPIYIMDKNTEYSYEIAKNKKGVFVLKPSGMVAINDAPKTVSNQAEVKYSTTPTVTNQATSTVLAPQTDVSTTETITTTTVVNDPANAENISVGMNVGGVGMNVNVNVNDGGVSTGTAIQSTTTQTVTTVKTNATSNTNSYNNEVSTPVYEPAPAQPLDGCYQAVSSTDFSAGINTIKKQSFADTQLKTAKTFTKNNCLSTNQIIEVIGLFSFEENKLTYAKYAYDYCVDKKNYYKVADAFTFSGSVDELNDFLETK